MCGIIGAFDLESRPAVHLDRLNRAIDSMAHRGPDDRGSFCGPGVVLGARRLSIIDLEGGHQPLANRQGTLRIVYNGEVYNHVELRRELEDLGREFLTSCDTEVVLRAVEEWGDEALLRLQGMFAFALWDERDRSLLLARDPLGVKPLYYTVDDGRLCFGSELEGIFRLSGLQPQADLLVLSAALEVGFTTGPGSAFRKVQKLPPGHLLRARDGRVETTRYWTPFSGDATIRPEAEIVDEFAQALQQSVVRQLRADVELGALLSGGLDSSSVVALAVAEQGPLPTVTIDVGVPGHKDATFAKDLAAHLSCPCHELTDARDPGLLTHIVRRLEEPLFSTACLATAHLYRGCKELGMKVVLVGEGADELLGGYTWYRGEAWIGLLLGFPKLARELFARSPPVRRRGGEGERLARVLRQGDPLLYRRYATWIGNDRTTTRSLLAPELRATLGLAPHPVLETWARHEQEVSHRDTFDRMSWIEAQTRMVEFNNFSVDRLSMAVSLEARPVFLDPRLWELVARIPSRYKMGPLFGRAPEKRLLRQAMRGKLPDSIRLRRKWGLTTPGISDWLRSERLPDWAEQALTRERIEALGLFNVAAVGELRSRLQAGAPSGAALFYSVLYAQIWAGTFLVGEFGELASA